MSNPQVASESTKGPIRNMISKEIVKAAIETSHAECAGILDGTNKHDCVHADGVAENMQLLREMTNTTLTITGGDPFSLVFLGIHIGYRMHQLASVPTPKEKVN